MSNDFGRAFGRRLRFWRDERGMTTETLAARIGLSPITVQRHMRGQNVPDLEKLAQYADILQVSASDLLPRLDSNQQPAGSGIAA